MRLALVMAVWQRHELTELVIRQYASQMRWLNDDGMLLRLYVVGSEGETSRALIRPFADVVTYVEAPNEPLGAKWNKGTEAAREMDPDAVIITGSDDLFSDSLIATIADDVNAGVRFGGFTDCWYFDATAQRLGHWAGYPASSPRYGEPLGTGRFFARDACTALAWRLFPDHLPSVNAIDRSQMQLMAAAGFTPPDTFRLADVGAKAVGIKVEKYGVTSWGQIPYDEVRTGEDAVDYLKELVDVRAFAALTTRWASKVPA